jgi:hypothetical protein
MVVRPRDPWPLASDAGFARSGRGPGANDRHALPDSARALDLAPEIDALLVHRFGANVDRAAPVPSALARLPDVFCFDSQTLC